MTTTATGSDLFDPDEGYDLDMDLINDLGVDAYTSVEYTTTDVYNQMVVTNRLLGILVAIMIICMIWALVKFFYRLITDNITNYF